MTRPGYEQRCRFYFEIFYFRNGKQHSGEKTPHHRRTTGENPQSPARNQYELNWTELKANMVTCPFPMVDVLNHWFKRMWRLVDGPWSMNSMSLIPSITVTCTYPIVNVLQHSSDLLSEVTCRLTSWGCSSHTHSMKGNAITPYRQFSSQIMHGDVDTLIQKVLHVTT